jgi:phosphate ABC transporter, permease protein PstA
MVLELKKDFAKRKRRSEKMAFGVFRAMSLLVVGILFIILGFIIIKGISVISWDFITKMPADGMTSGGIFPAIVGTLCLIAGSMIFSFPIGVLSGIYINEYLRNGYTVRFIRLMTNNLAGIPSIVFGLFGMSLFVNTMGFGDSLLAGSLTLGLLTLPVVIRTTEEALKAVDDSFRQGSYALGASKLYTVRKVVLPIAYPNIITGLILSIGRVSGETAPILFTVAAYFLPKLPTSIFDQAMALPYHLYVLATSGTDIEKSRPMAYGTALVLILLVLVMNLLANSLRRFFSKRVKMN